MNDLIKKHWELCEKYYKVTNKHLPLEFAFMTMEERIEWIEYELECYF
jgi:hypothetical protein